MRALAFTKFGGNMVLKEADSKTIHVAHLKKLITAQPSVLALAPSPDSVLLTFPEIAFCV